MQYTHLGRTGLKVSRLALGTMNFGEVTDEPTAHKILDAADGYGGPQRPDMEKGYGISEEIIGRRLHQNQGRREQIVLGTKVYQPMGLGPNERHLSAYHIREAAEDSLRRLQTDHIDMYQMHHVDRATGWEEISQALEQLVRDGKVLYVGSSNFAGWQIAVAQATAGRRNFLGLVREQSLYNLTARTIELEVIPSLSHHGMGLLPWSPLGGGPLGGVLKKIAAGRAPSERAWLLHQPAVTATIIGPRTFEQYQANLHALDLRLSEQTRTALDHIWPGPGGVAHEAYAW